MAIEWNDPAPVPPGNEMTCTGKDGEYTWTAQAYAGGDKWNLYRAGGGEPKGYGLYESLKKAKERAEIGGDPDVFTEEPPEEEPVDGDTQGA
jgi:hypothetical protein